jgi:two-component system chemotaxis sensor kinase CheA
MPDVVSSSEVQSLSEPPVGGPEVAGESPAKSIDEAIQVEAEQIAAEAGLVTDSEGVGVSEEELEAARQSLTGGKAGKQPGPSGEAATEGAEPSDGKAAPRTAKKPERPHELQKGNVNASVLRVDSRRIDSLLNLISEAVINKATFNQITTQFAEALADFQGAEAAFKEKQKELFDNLPEYLQKIHDGVPIKTIRKEIWETYGDIFTLFDAFEAKLKSTINDFRGTSQILGRNTSELHEKVLQIRMVPISQIFSRFPRLVRDVSKSLDKKIKLIIEGEDTELDKSVIEDLLDPLIHCVRNAVDHGVETPKERKKAGKPEEGKVLLKASNEGNMIIIEISDDGKGIDVESVRKKAVERGLIHPNKTLSDVEAFNLIFEPGFSTAREITNISGRGVGLDVVKKQIEKLNGQVSIVSSLGNGTRMTIKLPLTLAIIQGLLVRVGTEIYAIPITSVLDSHRIRPEEIKRIDNYEVFNVREDVISLIRLDQLFGIRSDETRKYHFVVIVGSGDKKMGLMVDSLIGEEDVVIKPLRDKYTNSPGIAGATILGDGTVSLIIDVSQLLDLGLRKEKEQRRLRGARST